MLSASAFLLMRTQHPCRSHLHISGSVFAEGLCCANCWNVVPPVGLSCFSPGIYSSPYSYRILAFSNYAPVPQTKRKMHAGGAGQCHCLVGGNHTQDLCVRHSWLCSRVSHRQLVLEEWKQDLRLMCVKSPNLQIITSGPLSAFY